MSVHDETWDRPVCDFCQKEIKYGQKEKHRDGICKETKNRVIIAGSRHLYNYGLVVEAIKESGFKIDEIICGCAKGVDQNGKIYGKKNNIPVKEFPADWDNLEKQPCIIKTNKYGKQYNALAGHNRNREMAEHSNYLILIWDGKSSGSANTKKLAKERGLIIYEKIINE